MNFHPMPNPTSPEPAASSDTAESFATLFSEYESAHRRQNEGAGRQIEGTIVAVSADGVFVDVGLKIEGVLPLLAFPEGAPPQPGQKVLVSIKGRNEEGYYDLSRTKVEQPKDWESLERAFAEKAIIVGRVTAVVKGGLSVDVGVRAFMPASRSGARDEAEMLKLVDQEIACRIIKLDVAEEDVVVDRRAVAEEEARATGERRYAEMREGDTVSGTVRSLAAYGAFLDIGGVDALLHVSDLAWSRIDNPADVLTVGQQMEVKVLKIDAEKRRISVGLKQLQPHPWDAVPQKYAAGQREHGTVTRTTDFGAFVELEPGIEGLVHISEMSWAKKVRKASDMVKSGDTVEVVILGINLEERRISLGLKQALGDPWVEASQKFTPGAQVEGPVTSFTKFGAFLQVAEGVEGMIHVSEISAEKHINHPQDVLRIGQRVKAAVLSLDPQKRQLRLSIKKLVPTGMDEFLAEHQEGDVVTGRLMEESGKEARVELGEGIFASCRMSSEQTGLDAGEPPGQQSGAGGAADLSSLTSMLQARWKGAAAAGAPKVEAVRAGQIRSFRIVRLMRDEKTIELELA
jgi:small subunit ribosomal protein S1